MKHTIKSVYEFCIAKADVRFFHGRNALMDYVSFHSSRFLDALCDLAKVISLDSLVLELGIRPYLLAELIKEDYGCCVVGANNGPNEEVNGIKTFGVNIEKDSIPMEISSVDLVIMTEVLEHLLDPSSVFYEIHRLLKDGGYLYLTTPNAVAINNRVNLLFGRSIYAKFGIGSVYERHNREYTKDEIISVSTSFGFGVIRLNFRNYKDLRGRERGFLPHLSLLNASWGERIDMLAIKKSGIAERFLPSIYNPPQVNYRK